MQCAACGQENPDGFKFCGSCGAPLGEAPVPREVRKTVTVVFCDLTGSTALGDVTDPEALRSTMRGYYEEMRAILERHGGTVEKFIGDAVMAVFGVPVAHEDDALRAVRAAWEMRAAVPALGLTARIGVNTGEVVAGEGDALVTGDAVNVAARLEQAAEAGEVLIGAETRSLVRDAVEVEPVTVTAKGKPEPVAAFRLVHLDVDAAAIARKLDTPLVGRRDELEQLRGAFERAVREQRCHLFTLLGPAGVGKSRLVAAFLAGVDATVVEGRCLDYGDGITFWPVVAILKQLGERADGTLTKVVEGGSLPNEIPWAVRTLLEEVAAERPLVAVFDDIQWGEETFLDLIDHVADLSRGAPILLLCIARPELLDKRPAWAGGKLNATTILLEPLSAAECGELIAAHGGVDEEIRERILAAADGNPLFVEEMVAFANEGGDVRVPATVQALLQARIDQLAGGERSVIERAAVEGQVFHRGAVAELARPAQVDPELVGLVRKELIHPTSATLVGDQAFRFRHLLIRDAAYDSLPKETRAELHERFAIWLGEHGADLIELDELLGYHLEQAARYRRELGRGDPGLEQRAADHLAAAGRRAAERGDGPAAMNLLGRALELLPDGAADWRAAFLDRLALAVGGAGTDDPMEMIGKLEASDDPALRMHGGIARLQIRIWTDADDTVPQVAGLTADALRIFEAADDRRGLAAAWRLRAQAGWLQSLARDTLAAMEEADRHAASTDAVALKGLEQVMRIGPLLHGPFTPAEVRDRLEPHRAADPIGAIVIEAHLAAIAGDFETAIAKTLEVEVAMQQLGVEVMTLPPRVARAKHFESQGRLDDAIALWDVTIALTRDLGHTSFLSTMLVDAAVSHYLAGNVEEAERLALEGEEVGAEEDVVNFALGRAVRGRIAADRGDLAAAEGLARDGLDFADRTDFLRVRAEAREALASVLAAAGRADEARVAYGEALDIYERYGWTWNAERVRDLLVQL